jgi:hypothetical protein
MNNTDGTSQKIRLTGTPVACASCYGQYVDRRHVDFGASTDGAVLAGPSNIAGGKGQSIDEVIVCDECLAAAAHTPVDREAVNKERERREQLRKQLSSVGTVKFGEEQQ